MNPGVEQNTRAAVLEDGRRAVREHEGEHGRVSEDSRAGARRVLDDLEIGQPGRRAAGP